MSLYRRRSHGGALTLFEPSRGTSTAFSQSTFRQKPDVWSMASTIFCRPTRGSGEPLNVNSSRWEKVSSSAWSASRSHFASKTFLMCSMDHA